MTLLELLLLDTNASEGCLRMMQLTEDNRTRALRTRTVKVSRVWLEPTANLLE
jgi:hypothetical protein